MSIYIWVLLIHILAAVIGLGSAFALPIIMNRAKTVSQAKFSMTIFSGVEKLAKIGSITLLLTGIILGIINPSLFKEFWYIASLVIYIAVQPIVAGILPKKMSAQNAILDETTDDELPASYLAISKQMIPYNNATHIATVILILLMTIKPF